MKLSLLIAAIAAATCLTNGAQAKSAKDSLLVPAQPSEAEAVAAAEALIPGIMDGTNMDVALSAYINNCWIRSNTIFIDELKIKKSYVMGSEGKLVPSYGGLIRYRMTDCK